MNCLIDLEHGEECGIQFFEYVVTNKSCPQFRCFSSASRYAIKVGRVDEFAKALAWIGALPYVPSIEVVGNCMTALAYPIAVDAFYVIQYGIKSPIVKGYGLLSFDMYVELIKRIIFSKRVDESKRSSSAERPQTQLYVNTQSPPCIDNLLRMLQSGVELPHSARFFLVTYFNYINKHQSIDVRVQMISRLFVTSPDYDPKKTEYQVKHILGQISGRQYSVPSCKWIKTEGYCVADCGVDHPLKLLRRKPRVLT